METCGGSKTCTGDAQQVNAFDVLPNEIVETILAISTEPLLYKSSIGPYGDTEVPTTTTKKGGVEPTVGRDAFELRSGTIARCLDQELDARLTSAVCRSVCARWRALIPRYDRDDRFRPLTWWSRVSPGVSRRRRASLLFCLATPRSSFSFLSWLHLNGCSFDEAVFTKAAALGRMDVIRWLHVEGCPYEQKKVLGAAASGGHIEILDWVHENEGIPPWDYGIVRDLFYLAARAGRLAVVDWLHSKGYECRRNTGRHLFELAVYSGCVDLLRSLRDRGHIGDCGRAFDDALCAGHLEVLRWLLSEGLVKRRDAIGVHPLFAAICRGHLGIAKWLRSEGCAWPRRACENAINWAHLDILQWLRSEGCPWNVAECLHLARSDPKLHHIAEWIQSVAAEAERKDKDISLTSACCTFPHDHG
jgi:hypothetical protein